MHELLHRNLLTFYLLITGDVLELFIESGGKDYDNTGRSRDCMKYHTALRTI